MEDPKTKKPINVDWMERIHKESDEYEILEAFNKCFETPKMLIHNARINKRLINEYAMKFFKR